MVALIVGICRVDELCFLCVITASSFILLCMTCCARPCKLQVYFLTWS